MSLWDDLTNKALHVDKVIDAESGGNPNAVSRAGAIGLMQIMPDTGEMFGVSPEELRNPDTNKRVGTQYLAYLRNRYGGNMRLAHAAYNWGPEHIDRTGDNPNEWPAETRNYVDKIMGPAAKPMSMWDRLQQKASSEPASKSADVLPATKITSSDTHDFGYDPEQAEEVEPGVTKGLQPSMIQPADLATFGIEGFAKAAGETALREGTGILAPEALKAGLGAAGKAAAGIPISGLAQQVASPLTNVIPTDSPAGVLARETAEDIAGASPFVAPEALSGIGSKVSSRFYAKPDLEATATEAAQKTEAENAKAQEKLDTTAENEAAKQKEATANAAEKAGQSRLAARTDTIKGVKSAQTSMDATKRDADVKAAEATAKLQKTAAQEVLPEAKVAAAQTSAGNPPSPYMPMGPARIARDAEFRDTVTSPLIDWRHGWGARRNEALASVLKDKPGTGAINEGAARELSKWRDVGHKPYSPQVAGLLDWASQVGIPKPPTDEELLAQAGYSPEDIVAFHAPAKAGSKDLGPPLPGRERPELANEQPSLPMGQRLIQQLREEWENQPHEAEKPTVAQLLSKQAQANKIAEASKGADRIGARSVSRAIDDALAGFAPTDELKSLNAEYRDHRQSFPYDFEDAVQHAAQPLDVAPELFNYPQRVSDLADLGDSKTHRAIAQLYAQWVGQNGSRVIDPAQDIFLSKILPGTPFAHSSSWVYADKAENQIASVVDASPQVKAKWNAAVQAGEVKIKRDYAETLVKQAKQDAKNYGPLGEQLITQINLAHSPEDAANIVADFYQKLTPEAALKAQMPTEQTPAQAAGGAQVMAPRSARQAAQNFQGSDPDAAAIRALQDRGYQPTPLWRALKNRAVFWIPLTAGTLAVSGHASAYAAGGLAMMAPLGMRELMVRSMQNSLRDEATATSFYRALQHPAEPANWNLLTSEAARAGIASTIENAGGDAAALLNPGQEPQKDEPIALPPDPREKVPLPTLDVEWHKARDAKDTAQAKQIRDIVVRRMKAGEWKALDANTKRQLAPFIREISA